jgi:hypothetical protein
MQITEAALEQCAGSFVGVPQLVHEGAGEKLRRILALVVHLQGDLGVDAHPEVIVHDLEGCAPPRWAYGGRDAHRPSVHPHLLPHQHILNELLHPFLHYFGLDKEIWAGRPPTEHSRHVVASSKRQDRDRWAVVLEVGLRVVDR